MSRILKNDTTSHHLTIFRVCLETTQTAKTFNLITAF